MADPGEAPIVHGEIRATTKWKVNGDEITAIDTALDANSTNPLTNAATSAAISAITAPAGASFYVHMVMNPSAQHNAADPIQFASVETNINTFLDGSGNAIGGPGTPSAPRTTTGTELTPPWGLLVLLPRLPHLFVPQQRTVVSSINPHPP